MPVIDILRDKFTEIMRENGLADENVRIKLGALTARQSIGDPVRRDMLCLKGAKS